MKPRHLYLLTLSLAGCLIAALAACALTTASTAASPKPPPPPSDDLTKGFILQPLNFAVQHPYDLKLEERYKFDTATNTHDLWVFFTDKPHAPPPNTTAARTEMRLRDDTYKPNTGRHMLDCDLYIVPGTYACITQVFGTGPMAMIIVDQQGTVSDLRTHDVIGRQMNARWFNWKVIHDTGAIGPGAIKVYIDGKLADDKVSTSRQDSFYFKCGVYSRNDSTRNEVKIRNLKYWIQPPAAAPETQAVTASTRA